MPGLLRGVARTAVVAGTATSVSNRVSRRQANKWAAQGTLPAQQVQVQPAPAQPQTVYVAAPAPVAAAPAADDQLAQLERLGALRQSGVLTEEEFAAQKARILGM
jgi:hypothetical protein